MVFIIEATILIAACGSAFAGFSLHRHEQRPLKVGSVAIEIVEEGDQTNTNTTYTQHESWDAVVDNYVYIHNAFRNHLTYIRIKCEEGKVGDVSDDFQQWKDILDLHSRVEDEIFIPILQDRLGEIKNGSKQIPEDILSGKDHDEVKTHIEAVLGMINKEGGEGDDDDTTAALLIEKLKDLEVALDEHLVNEEKNIMPLMLEAFTTRELWALDSFIVNPKLGYCDEEMLMTVTKWWFGNLSIKEGWPLLNNFIQAGKQPPMPLEEWKKLQDAIPALQKFPTEDLMP